MVNSSGRCGGITCQSQLNLTVTQNLHALWKKACDELANSALKRNTANNNTVKNGISPHKVVYIGQLSTWHLVDGKKSCFVWGFFFFREMMKQYFHGSLSAYSVNPSKNGTRIFCFSFRERYSSLSFSGQMFKMSDKKSQSHSLAFFFFCTYSSSVSTEVISQRKGLTVQSSSG